jgi:CTP:phosphocholine cytidylyltransferase-like protein
LQHPVAHHLFISGTDSSRLMCNTSFWGKRFSASRYNRNKDTQHNTAQHNTTLWDTQAHRYEHTLKIETTKQKHSSFHSQYQALVDGQNKRSLDRLVT